jgi:hypothetical protein
VKFYRFIIGICLGITPGGWQMLLLRPGPAWMKTFCPFIWLPETDSNNKNQIKMSLVF